MLIAQSSKLLRQRRQAFTLLSDFELQAFGSDFVRFTVDQVPFLDVTRATILETHRRPGVIHISHLNGGARRQDLDNIASHDLSLGTYHNFKGICGIQGTGRQRRGQ